MKRKITATLCTISMLCTLFLPVSGSETTTNPTRAASVFDTLDILKHIIKMIEPLPLETHDVNQNGEVEILDALEMLKGMVKMRKPVEMPKEEIFLTPCPGCGDVRSYRPLSIDEYSPVNGIFVVLTHCVITKDNRDWTVEDFPDIDTVKVKNYNVNNGRRILHIELENHSKENVIKVIEQLIQREDIRFINADIGDGLCLVAMGHHCKYPCL